MGWTCAVKEEGQSMYDFFHQQVFQYWNAPGLPAQLRVLDAALVNAREFYVAVESSYRDTGERKVGALVILIKYHRGIRGLAVCWKYIDEEMGPYVTNCPQRILDLLTPTTNQTAEVWRRACRETSKKKRLHLRAGVVIKFKTPLWFTHGTVDTIRVVSIKGNTIRGRDGYDYPVRVSRDWLKRQEFSTE